MRVVLVNPPKSQADREEIAPPLGLLRLARVAQELGATVYVEDYNLLWHLDARLRSAFYEKATERLLAFEADVYGFTSMAVDSHVALELARRLKAPAAGSTDDRGWRTLFQHCIAGPHRVPLDRPGRDG